MSFRNRAALLEKMCEVSSRLTPDRMRCRFRRAGDDHERVERPLMLVGGDVSSGRPLRPPHVFEDFPGLGDCSIGSVGRALGSQDHSVGPLRFRSSVRLGPNHRAFTSETTDSELRVLTSEFWGATRWKRPPCALRTTWSGGDSSPLEKMI